MWKLFRGKKKNVLRNRVDTFEADTNQLLLGTFIFTMSVFLFPTFFVYYVFFLLVWIAILAMQCLIFLLIVAIDACPIYAIVQRYIDPTRFPSGIHIGLETQHFDSVPYTAINDAGITAASRDRASRLVRAGRKRVPAAHPRTVGRTACTPFSFSDLGKVFSSLLFNNEPFAMNSSPNVPRKGGDNRPVARTTHMSLCSVAAPFSSLLYRCAAAASLLCSTSLRMYTSHGSQACICFCCVSPARGWQLPWCSVTGMRIMA